MWRGAEVDRTAAVPGRRRRGFVDELRLRLGRAAGRSAGRFYPAAWLQVAADIMTGVAGGVEADRTASICGRLCCGCIDEFRSDFGRRCRAVRDVPFDVALQPGGRILLRKLAGSTRQAYLQVAADIMTGVAGR